MRRPEGVNADNWRTAPFSQWAFHHVEAVLDTEEIAARGGKPWGRRPLSLDAFELAMPDGAGLDLERFLALTHTDALVIARGDELLFERYFNGNGVDRSHILMSSSKALLGLIGALLARRGEVGMAVPVTEYVPEVADTGYAGVTLRQLLDMRTGVRLDAGRARAYERVLHDDPAGLHGLLAGLPGSGQPHGGAFDYLSANSDLAGWVMERATGRRFADLASELLWRPLGAERPARLIVDGQGAPWCAGGWCTTARDFARVGTWLLGSEPWLLDDLIDGGDAAAWRDGAWGDAFAAVSSSMRYRAGWYAVHDAPGYLFAMGVHGQNLFIDRQTGVVIAKFSCYPERVDRRVTGLTHRAARELFRLVAAG